MKSDYKQRKIFIGLFRDRNATLSHGHPDLSTSLNAAQLTFDSEGSFGPFLNSTVN